jgi:hypothetical protein
VPDHDPHDAETGIEAIEQYLSRSPVLERVIEVNETVEAQGGGRVVVTSVELWTTLIVVHHAVVGSEGMRHPPSEADAAETQRRFEYTRNLRDNLGNTYGIAGGGGGGGGDTAMRFEQYQTTFRGPIDPGATSLVFRPANSARDCEIEIGI